jgi:predicted O-methyltransferase YrrM
MSPTNLQKILNLITTKKPNQIVEFGSGLSTLFIAYCIHGLGQGSIISYDHDKRFAELNNKILLDHGLSNYAKVIYAPLKTMTIHQSKWLWYKPNNDTFPDHIDFLVIDGPPRKTQKLARYPALHAIYNKLSVNATIVLDDSSRKDEKNILKKWQEEFSQLSTIDMEDIENLKVLRMS